jgi:hypothetical protein
VANLSTCRGHFGVGLDRANRTVDINDRRIVPGAGNRNRTIQLPDRRAFRLLLFPTCRFPHLNECAEGRGCLFLKELRAGIVWLQCRGGKKQLQMGGRLPISQKLPATGYLHKRVDQLALLLVPLPGARLDRLMPNRGPDGRIINSSKV